MTAPAIEPRVLGKPINRVDGRLKVTGAALYAAEFNPAGVLHAYALSSHVANGSITSIDTKAAESAPGVKAVLTHLNAPKLKEPKPAQQSGGGIRNEMRLPLSDDQIHYGGQYVALVVAETLEQARHAASLITVTYGQNPPVLQRQPSDKGKTPKVNNGEPVQLDKGNANKALADASNVIVEHVYQTPQETHSPMEPSATVAEWVAADQLTVHDATQYVKGVQDQLSKTFGLKLENVRVISPFVGGAFGCKGAVWPHVFLAAMAAKVAGAPVKFAISRQDMFSGTGHRTPTTQSVALAATRDGKLQAIRHRIETLTSPVGEYVESCGARSTGVLYASPSISVEETIYAVNVATPTFMRAPGECPGTYALECAMDELAAELKIDPVQLRVINHADSHPIHDKPYSAKHLKEAYQLGAEKFGWAKRTPEPGSMKRDGLLIGWGMATATYPAYKMAADARIQMKADGTVHVQCAAHDIGTGAYTVLTQIAAEAVGVPVEKVTFELGNSDLPFGPVAGGSNTTATVGSAVYDAAKALHLSLAKLATNDAQSPLHGFKPSKVTLTTEGMLTAEEDPSKSDSFTEILKRAGKDSIESNGSFKPSLLKPKLAFQSFGAQFCEVAIDPAHPRVQVTRFVSVMNCGRVMNAKTARSQILGGVVMGIGMALHEETVLDPTTGLPATRNLADYHVPVNADVPDIEVHFVGEPDLEFNPMGARGMGEIGITGTAAAVANAVYHATGKRVRDLPITLDKLLV
ncbi:MAG TPA: xanthine dehydrogenase family protein molybdopterin-binding subunit [Chthoniobacter sp.]|nr:xanthine dehydrogenase family protein molybdopterin-binding subunit [Chthoniobacter sp.]